MARTHSTKRKGTRGGVPAKRARAEAETAATTTAYDEGDKDAQQLIRNIRRQVAQAEKAAKEAVDERMKARKAKKKALESMRGQGVKGTRTRDNTTKDLGDVFDPDENA